jgi:hypothetical protein
MADLLSHFLRPLSTFSGEAHFSGQAVMTWLCYRSRAVSCSSWSDSDFVVFGLPFLAGFIVSAAIAFLSYPELPTSKRLTRTLVLSTAIAIASFFVGALIAFNLYGT